MFIFVYPDPKYPEEGFRLSSITIFQKIIVYFLLAFSVPFFQWRVQMKKNKVRRRSANRGWCRHRTNGCTKPVVLFLIIFFRWSHATWQWDTPKRVVIIFSVSMIYSRNLYPLNHASKKLRLIKHASLKIFLILSKEMWIHFSLLKILVFKVTICRNKCCKLI